jgi:hypothetical protein
MTTTMRAIVHYNKQRVAGLLVRAQEFLDTARDCAGVRPAVACDLTFSAAELSVQAQICSCNTGPNPTPSAEIGLRVGRITTMLPQNMRPLSASCTSTAQPDATPTRLSS